MIAIQRTFFDNDLATWTPPQDFPRLQGMVAVDIETKDPLIQSHGPGWFTRNEGFITGVAVAGEDWQAYYPVRHAGGNLPEESVFKWLRYELANPNLEVVMYNRLYDEGWLRYRYDVDIRGSIFDPMTAAALIDENRFSYALDAVSKTYLEGRHKDKQSFRDAAKMLGVPKPWEVMEQFPAPFVGPYAEQDVRLTWDLVAPMKRLLDTEDLWGIYTLESKLIPVLLEMRRRGVRVDLDKAERVGKEFERKHKDALREIHSLTNHHIDVWNNRDVAKMFDSLGITYGTTPKSGEPSITKHLLNSLEHPVGNMLLRARKYALAKGTFIDGHVLGHQVAGRIHGQFHPLRKDDDDSTGGAITGRFSSSNPNLQNLPAPDPDNPIKDEIGQAVRSLFIPETSEEQWAAADYSGQEPRLATHFAALARIRGVQPFVDAYRENPKMKFHAKGAEICGLAYKAAKNMTLGKMYGMGGAKLCHDLGLETQWIEGRDGRQIEVAGTEGQKIFDRYNEFMPWVPELAKLATRRAEQRGWIRTLCGRKRRFAPIHKQGAFSYKALNCLIQGSAADQMKQAMVTLYEQEKVVPLVTVHDELGFSVPDRAHAERLGQVMIDAVQLVVPNALDIEIGPNWGEVQ